MNDSCASSLSHRIASHCLALHATNVPKLQTQETLQAAIAGVGIQPQNTLSLSDSPPSQRIRHSGISTSEPATNHQPRGSTHPHPRHTSRLDLHSPHACKSSRIVAFAPVQAIETKAGRPTLEQTRLCLVAELAYSNIPQQ